MKPAPYGLTTTALAALVALLAILATTVGLFWPFPELVERVFPVSYRGTEVVLFGLGLYRHETLLLGAGNVAVDWITLCLGVPLLVLATVRARAASPAIDLMLLAILAYFLYVYATLALGAPFNPLFLIYVGLFSASLFAVVLVSWRVTVGLVTLPKAAIGKLPRRWPGILMIAAGIVTAMIWLLPLVTALLGGSYPPTLGHKTTSVTDALDLALIVPGAIVSGVAMLRGRVVGYTMAVALLGIIAMLIPTIMLSTLLQLQAGVELGVGEIVGPIGGFLVLGGLGVWALSAIVRAVGREAPAYASSG